MSSVRSGLFSGEGMLKTADQVHSSLKRQFRGELLRPADHGYEQASAIWNGMAAKTPGLIARCADVADVQSAVRAAAGAGPLSAVRRGGHNRRRPHTRAVRI